MQGIKKDYKEMHKKSRGIRYWTNHFQVAIKSAMKSRKSCTAGIKRGKEEKKPKGQAAKISPKRITMRVVLKVCDYVSDNDVNDDR